MPVIIDKNAVNSGDQDQINQLLVAHFIEFGKADDLSLTAEQTQHLAEVAAKSLNNYASWDIQHAPKMIAGLEKNAKMTLPSVTRAQIHFNILLVSYLAHAVKVEEPVAGLFSRLVLPIFCHSLWHMEMWQTKGDTIHPIRKLYDCLHEASLGWQKEYPKHSEAFQALMEDLVDQVLAIPVSDVRALDTFIEQAEQKISQFNQKFQKIAQRLCDSEAGTLKARQANETAVRFVNKLFKNKLLPQNVSSFIKGPLVPELKLVIIQNGLNGPQWLRIKKLLETMVSLYQPGYVDLADSRQKGMLTELPDELGKALADLSLPAEQKDSFLSGIAFDFAKIATLAADHELHPVEALALDCANTDIDTRVTKALLDQAKKFEQGQWFLHKDDAGRLTRMKLSLKLVDFDQLMFTNFVGKKVMSLSLSDFAYLLSSRTVVPMFQGSITEAAYQRMISELLEGYDDIYQQHLAIEKQREEEARQREIEAERQAKLAAERAEAERIEQERLAKIEAERAKAEAEAKEREAAAEKARAEAEAIRKQQEEEEKARELEKLTNDLRKQARLALDSLSLGSWIEIKKDPRAEMIRAKLAVKFNATKRYVFVDHDGITVGEYHRDDLVDLVLEGEARLLESDEKFAQRLVKVVETIKAAR